MSNTNTPQDSNPHSHYTDGASLQEVFASKTPFPEVEPLGFKESVRRLVGENVADTVGAIATKAADVAIDMLPQPSYQGRHVRTGRRPSPKHRAQAGRPVPAYNRAAIPLPLAASVSRAALDGVTVKLPTLKARKQRRAFGH